MKIETFWPVSAETARALVKYKFVPSATFVVSNPSDEVAMLVSAPVPPGESTRPYENEVAPVPPLPTPSVPVKRFVPIEVVATTCPDPFVERSELEIPASVSWPEELKLDVAVPPN